ncbi:restriction endonuclease subunit S [Cellulophaga baltica]|uniref:restriction endonuclease subunit S n=1 Tax=Cellulophaga TaxID=104264 RepID=UPI001C06E6AB|nr:MULTISPECIES: restriction endonuclease subunit S [Cellulophaga]MBU2997555.1 restriction endonuclease subunit S [Cellulophaga baltica]MDO6768950.1 restriction endonuclease subunit S [Cellulophaga sp. 1_MG-2023]
MDNINSTIPDTWELIKLGEITTYTKGYAFKSINYISEGTRVIRISDTNAHSIKEENPIFISNEDGQYDKWKLIENDLVFTTVGSKPPMYDSMVGKVIKVHKKQEGALLNQNAVILRGLKSKVNQHYLYHNFKLKKYLNFIETIVRGNANQVSITLKELFNYVIPLPPLKEQQKIAEILSQWGEAIETTQNLIEKLQLRKKGLMQELLSGKKRLAGFSEEWKRMNIGDVATQFTDKNKDDEDIEVLSCTKYDGLVPSLQYFGRKVYGDDLSKYKIVPRGYFAYATNHIEEGSIGYQDIWDKGLVSPMYTVFKTNDSIDDSFFFRLLKTDRMIYSYQSNMSGSIARRGGLRWNVFETLIIKIPSYEEQVSIANFFDKVDEEIITASNQLENLKQQKKGLMQQLLTGKKRVKI